MRLHGSPGRRLGLLLTATIGAAIALPAAPASAVGALEGWWPLAEGRGQTVYDWSGNRNHGTLGETSRADEHDPTWIKGRRWGYALQFDGNDYVQIPGADELEAQQLTVSLWFKGSQPPGPYKYLISKGGDGCVSASWAIQTSWNGGLWFQIWNGQQQAWSGGAEPTVWDGRWHHVAGTFDGTRMRMFLDGKLVEGGNIGQDAIEYDLDEQDASLGAYRADCELMFAGAIDQVTVWSKALPVDRIWNSWGWLLGEPTAS